LAVVAAAFKPVCTALRLPVTRRTFNSVVVVVVVVVSRVRESSQLAAAAASRRPSGGGCQPASECGVITMVVQVVRRCSKCQCCSCGLRLPPPQAVALV
jgi:hypothetical protein